MSVESVVVSHIVVNGDEALRYAIDHGITAEYFTEERSNIAFRFIVDFWSEYGTAPSKDHFERQFPNYKIVGDSNPITALVDELRNHHAITVARDHAPRITAAFTKKIPEFDLVEAVGTVTDLLEAVSIIRTVNETALLSERLWGYLEELFAMKGEELPGIPTGFATLDAASGGWLPENFGVIGAAPKRFKTAVLIWMALAAVQAGHRIKVVTFEMSIKELMDRIACFGSRVSYMHIQRGLLTVKEQRRLEDFEEQFKSWGGDIEIVHDVAAATTLAGLTSMLRNGERPQLLMIDGLYQMTDTSREWSNETAALTAVSRGIKRLAATEQIAIVGTTQALGSRITKSRGMELDSLGYTRAWSQDANVVIGIDREDMQSNVAVLKVVGARAMAGIAINITVDFEAGVIFEGGEVVDGGVALGYDD